MWGYQAELVSGVRLGPLSLGPSFIHGVGIGIVRPWIGLDTIETLDCSFICAGIFGSYEQTAQFIAGGPPKTKVYMTSLPPARRTHHKRHRERNMVFQRTPISAQASLGGACRGRINDSLPLSKCRQAAFITFFTRMIVRIMWFFAISRVNPPVQPVVLSTTSRFHRDLGGSIKQIVQPNYRWVKRPRIQI